LAKFYAVTGLSRALIRFSNAQPEILASNYPNSKIPPTMLWIINES